MKAMILAAGLGTRLKPWTMYHPKALVPVKGIPMLERVLRRLKEEGFGEVVVNIHHFGDQIIEYLENRREETDMKIAISDERDSLLDTGGGLLAAGRILFKNNDNPFLVHNTDILSNADLRGLMEYHNEKGNDITLLTSDRDSSRKLIFDEDGILKGWHNLSTDEFRPAGFSPECSYHESAFSGIYIIGKKGMEKLEEYAEKIEDNEKGKKVFPVMDFFLSSINDIKIGEFRSDALFLIDIGKPATLEQANTLDFFK